MVSAAVLVTTHSVFAILALGGFACQTEERFGLSFVPPGMLPLDQAGMLR